MPVSISITHNKKTHEVEFDPADGLELLLSQLFSLTDVPPERQKLLSKGKILKTAEEVAEAAAAGKPVLLMGAPDPAAAAAAAACAAGGSNPKGKDCVGPTPEVPKELEQVFFQEDIEEVRNCCSRIFFGKREILQPVFVLRGGDRVCQACATTCQSASGQVAASEEATPFFCRCPQLGGLCLFAERVDTQVGKVAGRLGDLMLADLQQSHAAQAAAVRQAKAQLLGRQQEGNKERFMQRLLGAVEMTKQYEDPAMQRKALEAIPRAELERRADEAIAARAREGQAGRGRRDEIVCQLMHWFKHEYFRWVNSPPCDSCGGSNMERTGLAPPTPEERAGLAGHAETYLSSSSSAFYACRTETRFPRYNHVAALMKSRRGRCGEWAQCFTLFCRAMGYDARFINDWTDHVWTEVYSEELGRWVHMDPCEDIWDAPLTYEAGWGKKLSYVVATTPYESVCVARRYTNNWADVLTRRTDVPEAWVEATLASLTQRGASRLPPALAEAARARRDEERRQVPAIAPPRARPPPRH
eukprot:tig00021332_g20334.t1